jgi:hypothetical protein
MAILNDANMDILSVREQAIDIVDHDQARPRRHQSLGGVIQIQRPRFLQQAARHRSGPAALAYQLRPGHPGRASRSRRDPGDGKPAPPTLPRCGIGQRRPPSAGRTVNHEHTASARRRPVQQQANRRHLPVTPNKPHN